MSSLSHRVYLLYLSCLIYLIYLTWLIYLVYHIYHTYIYIYVLSTLSILAALSDLITNCPALSYLSLSYPVFSRRIHVGLACRVLSYLALCTYRSIYVISETAGAQNTGD